MAQSRLSTSQVARGVFWVGHLCAKTYTYFIVRKPGGSSDKALGYWLDDLISIAGGTEVEIFFIFSCPDWPWDLLSLL